MKTSGGPLRRSTRVIADTVIGYVLVAAGIVMLVTPGPGVLAIVAGLAVLARHYHFAERLKRFTISRIADAGTRLRARRAGRRISASTDEPVASPVGNDVEAA